MAAAFSFIITKLTCAISASKPEIQVTLNDVWLKLAA